MRLEERQPRLVRKIKLSPAHGCGQEANCTLPSSLLFRLPAFSLPSLPYRVLPSIPCNFERRFKSRQDLAYLYCGGVQRGHASLMRRGGGWDKEGCGGGRQEEEEEAEVEGG